MKNLLKSVSAIIVLLMSLNVLGQYGVSSGSISMAKSNDIIKSQNIFVEDFMNYHRHKIDIPTKEDVAITIDYNNAILTSKNEFILQVGVATQEIKNRKSRNNVNVSIVLDKSGSMSGSKMELVKKAIISFIENLSSEDYFSLVQFDSKAEVVIENRQIGNDITDLKKQIQNIRAYGSTNLNSGMIKGYEEAVKKHSKALNSRVILLTDGQTNVGETAVEKIIINSKKYNKKGIEISTIGVGQYLDFDLLRQLAVEGNGSNHFIGESEEDIQKVFVDEAQSLLYQIGKKAEVVVELPTNFKVLEFYGYQPKYSTNRVTIPIENLNAGNTQVLLMRVEGNRSEDTVSVKLNYEDVKAEEKQLVSKINYNTSQKTTNKEVTKNYHLAFMATNLKEAIREYENSNYGNMNSLLQKTKNEVDHYNYSDSDIERVIKIIDKFIISKNEISQNAYGFPY